MEVPREELTEDKYQEMAKIAVENVCAECGAELQVHTVPESGAVRVGCLDRSHCGWIEKETYTEIYRRGGELHPTVKAAVESHLMPKEDLNRAMNLLALRYPAAIRDPATAALFIVDCQRLDLDPLISPPEAVPLVFNTTIRRPGAADVKKAAVVMVITGDGWLSMAARGCKEDWLGPPRTMRLEEYLAAQPENAGRPREELAAVAAEIKKSESGDPAAWAYMAVGRRRAGDETAVAGFFTHADRDDARGKKLPSATQPGNQARVRAVKKWVRQVFPECRQSMITLSEEWYSRSEGVQAAQHYIDAEYRMITNRSETKSGARTGDGGGQDGPGGLGSGGSGGQGGQGRKKAESTDFGEQKVEKPQKSGGGPAGAAAVAGAELGAEIIKGVGFSIDPQFLAEALPLIKWSGDTAKSWLGTKYKIDTTGDLFKDVLPRCTKEQAQAFVAEVQTRLSKIQMKL